MYIYIYIYTHVYVYVCMYVHTLRIIWSIYGHVRVIHSGVHLDVCLCA